MDKKLTDTNATVSHGGRAESFWFGRVMINHSYFGKNNDVDIMKIVDTYNLSGFEFGNWLNNNDRYDRVLACRDSLKHLSDIMHSRNIGMDRLIGIAFGARGHGGKALAHYEPYYNMINISKPKGDGTLAHEYGHAIDYNFGRYVDTNTHYNYLSGGMSEARTLDDNNGGSIRKQMNDLINAICHTKSYDRIKNWPAYWHRRTEIFARFFEQYVSYVLDQNKTVDFFLTRLIIKYYAGDCYLTKDDFLQVKPIADKLIKLMGAAMNIKTK